MRKRNEKISTENQILEGINKITKMIMNEGSGGTRYQYKMVDNKIFIDTDDDGMDRYGEKGKYILYKNKKGDYTFDGYYDFFFMSDIVKLSKDITSIGKSDKEEWFYKNKIIAKFAYSRSSSEYNYVNIVNNKLFNKAIDELINKGQISKYDYTNKTDFLLDKMRYDGDTNTINVTTTKDFEYMELNQLSKKLVDIRDISNDIQSYLEDKGVEFSYFDINTADSNSFGFDSYDWAEGDITLIDINTQSNIYTFIVEYFPSGVSQYDIDDLYERQSIDFDVVSPVVIGVFVGLNKDGSYSIKTTKNKYNNYGRYGKTNNELKDGKWRL